MLPLKLGAAPPPQRVGWGQGQIGAWSPPRERARGEGPAREADGSVPFPPLPLTCRTTRGEPALTHGLSFPVCRWGGQRSLL